MLIFLLLCDILEHIDFLGSGKELFTKDAEILAKDFWTTYLSKTDKLSINKIMSMCSKKFLIMGMKDSKTATNRDDFRVELERVFANRKGDFEIAEQNLKSLPTGRNSCVIFGDISVSAHSNGLSSYYYTYGFTMAVKKEKEQLSMVYLHCWLMNKDSSAKNSQYVALGGAEKREWHGINIYQKSMGTTHDLVFGVDSETGYVCCDDERVKNLLGAENKIENIEALRELATLVIHPKDHDALLRQYEEVMTAADNKPTREFVSDYCRIRYIEEGYIWCKIGVIPSPGDRESNFKVLFYIRDANRFKEKEQMIRHESRRDPLTGCYNKIGAQLKIQEYLSSMNPVGIMMFFDINELKWVNENSGYDVGDQVLFDFSAILKRYIREEDVIARIDSDNFIVYIKGSRSKESLKRTISEVFEEFADYTYNRQLDSRIRCFTTVAWYGVDGETFEELYERVCARMEKIKHRGKRNYII